MFAGQLNCCAVLKVRGWGAREKLPCGKVSGDDSWRAPPVPIPNTEVKPPNADGTELGTAWESRKSPGSKSGSGRNGSFSRSGNERGRDGRKARPAMILSSSMAEHSAVNRRVVSSSLT